MKILIKDKKGLMLKNLFFAIVFISMSILAIQAWTSDWSTKYNSGINSELEKYEKMDYMTDQANRMSGNMSGQDPGTSGDFEGTILRSVFGIINNIFKPIEIVFGKNGWINSVATELGLPSYVSQGIITLIIFSLIFSIIAILFKLTRSSA